MINRNDIPKISPDYCALRSSTAKERIPQHQPATDEPKMCSKCGGSWPRIQMAHVGDEVFICKDCLGRKIK